MRSLFLLASVAALGLAACTSTPDHSKAPPVGVVEPTGISSDKAPNAQTLYSMAKLLAARGRDADAETILAKLIGQHPEFMPAYADLAEIYVRRERIESAVEVLRAGIQRVPADAVLQNDLGMCRLLQRRYEDALEAFTAAAAGVPPDIRARANMAVALGMLGRLDESLAIYLQILPPADAHYNVAVLSEARKDAERARQEYALAQSLAPRVDPAKAH
jgi:tetratricopeptide (TPR) repeat protein